MDQDTHRVLDDVVRGIAAASKVLRLYPPSSPIPRQSIESASAALTRFFEAATILSLAVSRDGLDYRGEPIAVSVPGAKDIAASLRSHDIAELDILPGCTAEELIALLSLLERDPAEVRAEGGLGASLVTSGSQNIRASEVRLTVVEDVSLVADASDEDFLRKLADDPDRLATWMLAAASSGSIAFAEGLQELNGAAQGVSGTTLRQNLAAAFQLQPAEGKDMLLGLGLEAGANRDLVGGVLSHLADVDLAGALTSGLYGQNMLSLSNALANLPLEDRSEEVFGAVQQILADGSVSEKERGFLSHMMEARSRPEPELALTEADAAYHRVAEAARIGDDELSAAREKTLESARGRFGSGITTMLTLLDQQTDYALYCENLRGLAALIPSLIEDGKLDLAVRVVRELGVRATRTTHPWPDLNDRIRDAIAHAFSEQAMSALLNSVIASEENHHGAREMTRLAEGSADSTLIGAAIALKAPGIAAAESILGRRVLDLLAASVSALQWFQVAPVVQRLAEDLGPRSIQAIDQLMARPDAQTRREVVTGLAAANTESSIGMLADLVADPDLQVSLAAVQALGNSASPRAALQLASRLKALDVDTRDFPMAREIIGALGKLRFPEATEVLNQISRRKTLIKRGHHAEVQELVRQAIAKHASAGGPM